MTTWALPGVVLATSSFTGAVVVAILNAVGFTAAGVAAGSVASFIHGFIGNVAAGSVFSVLQSAGAGGAGLAIVSGMAGTVFGVLGAGTAAAAAAFLWIL